MSKNLKISVDGKEITVYQIKDEDYICLTDMAKNQEENIVINKWLSLKHTVAYLGAWEKMHNPDFNYTDFGLIKNDAGDNKFGLSVKEWIERTNAIGITAKSGRYGGTYAHKDIAFQFGMWISPEFQLLLVQEFQRLKEKEGNAQNIEWNFKRVLSKANYQLHTAAVQEYRIPKENLPKDKEGIIFADEAEILNYAVFGFTSKAWREENAELVLKGHNLREYASINELAVLSNMESVNAVMLGANVSRKIRMEQLRIIAQQQLKALNNVDYEKSYRKISDGSFYNTTDKQIKVKLIDKVNNTDEKDSRLNFNGTFGDAIRTIGKAGKPKE